ncbi:uncharacterized protein METZ01_LOCUS472628, partial [marine metagenome]
MFYVFDDNGPPMTSGIKIKIMKIGSLRNLLSTLVAYAVLCPGMLATTVHAQEKSFGDQLMDSLGWTFLIPFLLMIVGGITIIIYNGIAIRKKAFVEEE